MSAEEKPIARRTRWAWVGLAGIGTSILLYYAASPSTPQGAFYDPDSSATGNSYMVVKDGKVYLQTPSSMELKGAYSRSNSVWTSQGGHCVLKPNLFGITLADPNGRGPRTFLYRRGFGWIADIRNWLRDLMTGGK